MHSHYKAFLVVMILTVLAFWLARSTFTKFMSDVDYVRRRNLWLSLTTCAFLIPSFWLYMGVSAVLIWRVGRRDPNPAALYLFLLLVVPPFQELIPGFGLVNQLFPLNHFRLLGLVLIVPAAIMIRREAAGLVNRAARSAWAAPDILLVMYGVLTVLLYAPHVSATSSMRSTLLLVVDLLLPYYVLSRSCTSKPKIVEAFAAFALAAMVLAPIAVFEAARGWLMYGGLADNWGTSADLGYLMRGDTLRAQATSGQSIVLGNFYVVVLGLWLYLQGKLTGWRRWLGTAAVLVSLLVAYSRGPWIGAVVCAFAFFAAGPSAKTRVLKLIGSAALVSAVTLASPLGDRIIDNLPFIGTVDTGSITYRQAVIDRMLVIIEQNPWFGSPFFVNYMEDLRQGQGIIDLLNVYLSIGMAYGLVTLAAFVLFLVTAAIKCVKVARANAERDPDTSKLGAALFGALSGTMLIMYTVSNYLSIPYIYVALAALMVAYSRVSSAVPEPAAQFSRPAEGMNQRGSLGMRG